MFDLKFLEVLACPETKGPLALSKNGCELISRQAGVAYPIEDGIPMLLIEKARPLSSDEVLNCE